MKTFWRYGLSALIVFLVVQGIGLFAINSGLTNTKGSIDLSIQSNPTWKESEEWKVLKEVLEKEVSDLNKASAATGVSPRLIASLLVVEQLRLYHDERELFKTVFAPLKVLGNQVQFSWGILGIKEATAENIERHLTATSSPWYISVSFEKMLDFTTSNQDNERFERIRDENNHYYSYLYAGLYIRQILTQWEKAGFPIHDKPEIIATLYNIGFENSHPKENPQIGGSVIVINGHPYSFGGLAGEFYRSNELIGSLPR